MKKYRILVRENGHPEYAACEVDSNPQDVVDALKEKTKKIDAGARKMWVNRYDSVRFEETTS